jgi:hypothetical protein
VTTLGSRKYLLVAAAYALMLVTVDLLSAKAQTQFAPQPAKVREVDFTYHTDLIGINSKAHHIEAWIPLPREDRFQQVSEIRLNSPVHVEVVNQPTNDNHVVYLSASVPPLGSIPVTIRFKVRRIEELADLQKAQVDIPEPIGGAFASYLGMAYDKSGKGWGRGDAIYACNVKKGNCTDFHSLFIAIARSRGIPAHFTIGFPLGAPSVGKIPGYHCWAEFYAGGQWVPVDASEAWQHPQLRNYYFGVID